MIADNPFHPIINIGCRITYSEICNSGTLGGQSYQCQHKLHSYLLQRLARIT